MCIKPVHFGLADLWSPSIFHVSAQDDVLCAIGARFDFGRVSGRMLTRFFREGGFVHGCKSVSKLAPLWHKAW